ncbi:MAG: hypothetical protein ACJAVK_000247 [Akkermansiaceae bacterium]|jgi:hypothetical protein
MRSKDHAITNFPQGLRLSRGIIQKLRIKVRSPSVVLRIESRLKPLVCRVLLASGSLAHANDPAGTAYFENHIRPLFIEHCDQCHSADAKKLKANLFLDSRAGWQTGGDSGPAIIPGKPEESLLFHAVSHTNGDLEMPPKNRLLDSEIEKLKDWIAMGAPDPREGQGKKSSPKINLEKGRQFWSFKPPLKHPIPKVKNPSWPTTSIDHFILARLESANLSPSQDASKRTLLRRINYDLTGLPPSPEEMRSFLADPSPTAFETIVDDLLARPEFGERWGRHWLDVTRFAESSGGGRSLVFPNAWRFRDYVINSFNQDKPYDQLVREHLAGDLLDHTSPAARNTQLIGSGYLILGALNYELQDHELLKMEFVDEQIDAVGRTFLGMTLGCARCHDHKFDPIAITDYYALAGIFQSTESMGKGSAASGVTSFAITKLAIENSGEIKDIRDSLAQLKSQISILKNQSGKTPALAITNPATLPGITIDSNEAKVTGNWIKSTSTTPWIGEGYLHDNNLLKGQKQVEFSTTLPATRKYEVLVSYSAGANRATNVPVTVHHADGETTVKIDQTKSADTLGCFVSVGTFPFSKDQRASVTISTKGTNNHVIADAVNFVEPGSFETPLVDRKKIEVETGLITREKELKSLTAKLKKLEVVTMAPSDADTIADGHVHIRGQVRNKGPKVPRGFISVVMKPGTSADIPADHSGRLELARWIADPEHPLTSRVIVNRLWKYLLGEGLVRTPDNFGQTGELPSHPELLDYLALRFVENDWSIKALIREIILSRTYQLSSQTSHDRDPANRLFGRANRKRLEAEAIRDTALIISGQLDPTRGGPTIRNAGQYDLNYVFDSKRRSVYVPWFRNSMLDLFEVFDAPNPNLVVGKRSVTNLPTQALFLMNSPFIREQSQLTAQRLLTEKATITHAYQLILSRPPSESERTTTANFLTQFPPDQKAEAWTQLCQTLFSCIDFRFID